MWGGRPPAGLWCLRLVCQVPMMEVVGLWQLQAPQLPYEGPPALCRGRGKSWDDIKSIRALQWGNAGGPCSAGGLACQCRKGWHANPIVPA